jgi:hypothetical protein
MTPHFDPDFNECQYGLQTGAAIRGVSDADP